MIDEPEAILRDSKTIAVVGLSPNPERPSHGIATHLQAQGYRIIPVNPNAESILGERSYSNLRAIPVPVDVVQIFRKPEDVPPIVEEVIAIGAKAVWMQEGIVHEGAGERGRHAGLMVVMDRCRRATHRALRAAGRL